MYADYRLPKGYNPASPDTLRIYMADFDHYFVKDRIDYMTVIFPGLIIGGDTANGLCPRFQYPNPIPDKGVGPIMRAANKKVIDYVLTDADSAVVASLTGVRTKQIHIPIKDGGYGVPAGNVLSVVVQFIPGFKYNHVDTLVHEKTHEFEADTFFRAGSTFVVGSDVLTFDDDILIVTKDTQFYTTDTLVFGDDTVSFESDTFYLKNNVFVLENALYYHHDTLKITTYNTSLSNNDQLIDVEYRMNTFSTVVWHADNSTSKYFYDYNGYNTFFKETQGIRHNNPQTANDTFCTNSTTMIYDPGSGYKTVFWMSLSEGDDYITSITHYTDNLISKIYPNPATSQLTIDLNEEGTAIVTVYNVLGQAVIEETLQGISNKINIAELSSGLYFVKVNQNGRNHTVKISKE